SSDLAESAEEIAGYKLPIEGLRRRTRSGFTDTEGRVAGLQCRQIDELGRLRTKVPIGFPREEGKISVIALRVATPIAAADLIADPPELFGLRHRQRFQHHLMHQRKDCAGSADSQRECDHRRRSNSRRLP